MVEVIDLTTIAAMLNWGPRSDVVTPRDPGEVGPNRPDVAVVILRQQQTDWPVQPRIGIGRDELRAERRIAEDKQGGRAQLDAGICRELRLVDLVKEPDALDCNVSLDADDRLGHRNRALDADDAIVAVGPRSRAS